MNRCFLIALLLSALLHLSILASGLLPHGFIIEPNTPLRTVSVALQPLQATMQTPTQPKPTQLRVQLKPAHTIKTRSIITASTPEISPTLAIIEAQTYPIEAQTYPMAPDHPAASMIITASETTHLANIDNSELEQDSATSGNEHPIRPHKPLKQFARNAALTYQGFYGPIMAGTGAINWRYHSGQYELDILVTPIIGPALRYFSTGTFTTTQGLRPDYLQAWRAEQQRESATFDWSKHILRYGDQGDKETVLEDHAQDVFSLAFQLGYKGGRLGTKPLQITTGKKVYHYPLQPAGETHYETWDGKIRVVVFRAQGDDNEMTEFWLAPDFANLPIRIKYTDQDKTFDLRAIRIKVNEEEYWKLSPPPRKHS